MRSMQVFWYRLGSSMNLIELQLAQYGTGVLIFFGAFLTGDALLRLDYLWMMLFGVSLGIFSKFFIDVSRSIREIKNKRLQ